MLLSAEHLSINFGSRQLLEDVNFYLNEGDNLPKPQCAGEPFGAKSAHGG